MHMALSLSPRDRPVTIFTDSMNVVYAIQAFNSGEFARDMRHQLNADIIKLIMMELNLRHAPTKIVKIKSHRGSYLNECADEAAGNARAAPPDEVETRYADFDYNINGMSFSWPNSDDAGADIITTKDPKIILKRWTATAAQLQITAARLAGTSG